MTDKNLIKQLKALKEIKPREEWVVLMKENVFKNETIDFEERKGFISVLVEVLFNHKPAFAFSLCAVVFFGLFGFAQSSMPGDSLFALKKITERGQAALVSEKNKGKHDLEMVSRRLDDLNKIAQSSAGKNIKPAIDEYRQTASDAAKSIAQSTDMKAIAGEVKKIQEKEQEIELTLGAELGKTDLDSELSNVVQREIDYLKAKNLSEQENAILERAVTHYENGNYAESMEELITIGR